MFYKLVFKHAQALTDTRWPLEHFVESLAVLSFPAVTHLFVLFIVKKAFSLKPFISENICNKVDCSLEFFKIFLPVTKCDHVVGEPQSWLSCCPSDRQSCVVSVVSHRVVSVSPGSSVQSIKHHCCMKSLCFLLFSSQMKLLNLCVVQDLQC